LSFLTICLSSHKQTLTKAKTPPYSPSLKRYANDLPREQYDYWHRPEIFVIYWLFFAVGFTEEGMDALHDLISTGNQDFNDPVFWLNYIISPVNTITEDIKKMLPECVQVTFRSPVNRKAYTLWRYKTALSYIKTIVTFGDAKKLNATKMNQTTQPNLHALVSSKKYGKYKYETESSNKSAKNNYVEGLLRAFLISFPEKFKEWSEATILRCKENKAQKEKEGKTSKKRDTTPSIRNGNTPCDLKIDATAVWCSFKTNGVFEPGAKYDIPENWDAYKVFDNMNRGHTVLQKFTTPTLKRIVTENEKETEPKKRKRESKWC
jgi:hypothetical protein